MHRDIEAVFLDVGGTLRLMAEDEPFQARARRRIAEFVGTEESPESFCAVLDQRYKAYRKWAFGTLREAREEELWTRWLLPDRPADRIGPLAGELTLLYRQTMGRRFAVPDAGRVVAELSGRGYRLGIISNTSTEREIPQWLEEEGLAAYFPTVVLSSTFGHRKPGVEIYLEAARRAGVDPARSVYVADNPARDVPGCRRAGFAAVIIMGVMEEKDPAAEDRPDLLIHGLADLLDVFPAHGGIPRREAPAASDDRFSAVLYAGMKRISAGIGEMEPYEFRYALENLAPREGWAGVRLDAMAEIEVRLRDGGFYRSIQLKPLRDGKIVLDGTVAGLTVMLLAGLAAGRYPEEWIRNLFHFDVRGFYFIHRTLYFTDAVLAHLGGGPLRTFPGTQRRFERCQAIGYGEFREANAAVDGAFIESVRRLMDARGLPVLVALAGPTAAGKTEIVDRLRGRLEEEGRTVASIEMDNFLTDRDERESNGIDSLGRRAMHFEAFLSCLEHIRHGRKISIPRYDSVQAVSSHDRDGNLKPGSSGLEILPADVVFIEGNFPFLYPEAASLIGIKVVYLTDDDVRLKRKWRRDVDFRRKYDPNYLRNRYFKEQFLMAMECYIPQMEACDMVVDTTGAAIWATPETAALLAAARESSHG